MAINTNRELIGFAAFCAAQTVPTKIRSPGPGWMIPSFHRVLIEICMVLGCPLPDHRHHNGFGSGTPSRDHAAGMNGCLKRGRRSSTSPARKRSSNACSSVCSHSWKTWEEGLRLLKHIKTVLSDELSTNGDTTRLDIKKNISISPKKEVRLGQDLNHGANSKSIRFSTELQVDFLCLALVPPGSVLVLLDDAAAIQA